MARRRTADGGAWDHWESGWGGGGMCTGNAADVTCLGGAARVMFGCNLVAETPKQRGAKPDSSHEVGGELKQRRRKTEKAQKAEKGGGQGTKLWN